MAVGGGDFSSLGLVLVGWKIEPGIWVGPTYEKLLCAVFTFIVAVVRGRDQVSMNDIELRPKFWINPSLLRK